MCWSLSSGLVVTCIVGFLQEHAVLLGPQGSLADTRLAQQGGCGVCRSVPVGRVLRYLPAGQVLHGFGGVGGDSEMEKGSWVCVHGCECHGHRGPPWSGSGIATSSHVPTLTFSGLAEPWEEGRGLTASGTLLRRQHCPWDFPAGVGGTGMAGRTWRVQGTASPALALVPTWRGSQSF